MASIEQEAPLDREALDVGFKAALGFYLGVFVAGWSAIAASLAGATTAVTLATVPGTVTIVLLLVFVGVNRVPVRPERLGTSRRRRLGWYALPATFAAVLALPAATPIDYTGRLVVLSIAAALVSTAIAAGLARLCRNRYVAAITSDDPVAVWTWRPSGAGATSRAAFAGLAASAMLLAGLANFASGTPFLGVMFVGYGLYWLVTIAGDWTDWGPWSESESTGRWSERPLRAHEAGLVVERSIGAKLVPWDAITGVELTADELVLERRWVDVRCDRDAIDDPEAVLEGIERARRDREERETVDASK